MNKKPITVRLNDCVLTRIEAHKNKKKISSFSEAMNDLFLEFIKFELEQKELKEDTKKNADNIEIISSNIKMIASYLKTINEKK